MTKVTSTSGSGEAKLQRAINQILNAEKLISGLPRPYWDDNEKLIRQSISKLQNVRDTIRQELVQPK